MTDVMTDTLTPLSTQMMTQNASRFDAIDSAKGVGIILVVFGHAWRGAMGAGLIGDAGGFRLIDAAVYAFHMPLFFFLSGLLFLDALKKHDTVPLLRGRLTRLLWPMALWTWVFFGLKLIAGPEANSPVTIADFPLIPLPPYEHLWFLWALFLCHSILILAYSYVPKHIDESRWHIGAAVLAVALALLSSFIFVPSLIWGPMIEHAPYFLIGIAAARFLTVQLSHWVTLACILGFTASLMLVQGDKASIPHSMAILLLGWFLWLGVDRLLGSTSKPLAVLGSLGRASMVIYLSHTAFTAATRIVMIRFGVDSLGLVMAVTVLAGLVLPLILLWVARCLKMEKLLGF